MRYFKFVLMHVLIDTFFIVGLVYVYLTGAAGSIVIREFPIVIVALFSIFIGIKNIGKLPIGEILGQISITLAMFFAYTKATQDNYDILASDIWFIRIVRGLVLLICFYVILNFIKRILNSFIKCAQIFYVANVERNFSIIESFIGATLKFKATIAIPIFNNVIRSCVKDLCDIARRTTNTSEGVEGAEPSAQQEMGSINSLISNLGNSKLGKASKWVFQLYMDYIDECVLLYCYKHQEKSVLRASLEAITVFLSNCIKIIEKMSVIIIMQVIIRIFLVGIGILLFFTVPAVTLRKTLIGFIIFKMLEFFIQDAIIEPLMMNRILETFGTFSYENDNALNKILDKFPVLNKIKKLQHSSEPDDLDITDDNTCKSEETAEESTVNVEETDKDVYQQEAEDRERETLL